ncbi:hypothetical protein SLOPH_1673 [Spraguea lophii 42_110]|uniref:RanBD1 domain-containing protein n=1 Tax=Spraguea lophii (strain 42_110) TaxID=1358809 RepID=S7XTN0_SPRLO|nr:hypothetical protein SLOPH_1673 [Spraguea lophii 42_110]
MSESKNKKTTSTKKPQGLFPEVKVETTGNNIFKTNNAEAKKITPNEFIETKGNKDKSNKSNDNKDNTNDTVPANINIPEANILFESDAQLYRFENGWNVCGVGKIYVIQNHGNVKRVMFIRNKILTTIDILLNYDINLNRDKNKVYFIVLENNEEGEAKMVTVAVKFRKEEDAEKFCGEVQ